MGAKFTEWLLATIYVPEDSKKTIYYDRNNPSKMRSSTSSSGGIIMSAFGLPFCAVELDC